VEPSPRPSSRPTSADERWRRWGPTTQNADGTAHFAYFDEPHQLSFIWDGQSTEAEVSFGGYGEPVTDRIPLDEILPALFVDSDIGGQPIDWLDWFTQVCRNYIDEGRAHGRE